MIDIPVQLTHRLSEMHQNLCWIDEQNPKSQTITAIMSLVKDCNSPPESLELTQKTINWRLWKKASPSWFARDSWTSWAWWFLDDQKHKQRHDAGSICTDILSTIELNALPFLIWKNTQFQMTLEFFSQTQSSPTQHFKSLRFQKTGRPKIPPCGFSRCLARCLAALPVEIGANLMLMSWFPNGPAAGSRNVSSAVNATLFPPPTHIGCCRGG